MLGAAKMDQRTLAEAFSYPGIDPRAWVSYAIVETVQAETENPVEFDADDGQIYVNCVLKPSNQPCRARLGGAFSGPGEGFYSPFVGGEEVLLAIPEGDTKTGAVVLARLSNGYDGFPMGSVGGKDADTNTFTMMRSRPAITIESGASVLLRSASMGAMMQLAGTGAVTLRDGAADVLQISPDVFGYQNGEGTVIQQIDLNAKRFTLAVGDVLLTLSGDLGQPYPQSLIQVPSTLTLSASGSTMNNAVEHVTTTEAVANILANIVPGGSAVVAAAITAAAASPLSPLVSTAIQAAFATATAKPPGVPGLGQVAPGIGSVGVLTG